MFTNAWFEITAKANFEKYVLPIITESETPYFLEVGCYEGQASVWLMENTKANLSVIDTFKGSREHDSQFEQTLLARFKDNIAPYEDRVNIIEGTSRHSLKLLEENTFSFIYIDGSHQASDVLEDAILAFPLLKEGALMIFDDYTWGIGMPFYDIPSSGINAFIKLYGNQLTVLERNAQVMIRKNMAVPLD